MSAKEEEINTIPEEKYKLPPANEETVAYFGKKSAEFRLSLQDYVNERVLNDYDNEETLKEKSSGYYQLLIARGALSDKNSSPITRKKY
jgi:hypothetical protein